MVILGPVDTKRRTAQGIAPRVVIDGEQAAQTNDPAKLAGDLVEVVSLTAELLELCGERLRAGEVVITGCVVPPLPVAPGQRVQVDLPAARDSHRSADVAPACDVRVAAHAQGPSSAGASGSEQVRQRSNAATRANALGASQTAHRWEAADSGHPFAMARQQSKRSFVTRVRSAVTGRFVKSSQAKRSPRTTVTERFRKAKKR